MDNVQQSMEGGDLAQENLAPVSAEEIITQEGDESQVESEGTQAPETPEDKVEARIKRMEAKYDKRIQRLVAEKKDLAERQQSMEAFLQQATQRPKSKADFDTKEEWDMYQQEQSARKVLAERDQQIQKHRQAQTAEQAALQQWGNKVQTVITRLPDYHEVVGESEVSFATMPDVFQGIMESDVGPDLAYFLAKNPEEAQKMESMSVNSRQRYLARMELKLEQQTLIPARKAPKPTAPARVPGGGMPTQNPSEMSFKDFKALRDSGKKFW